VSVYELFERPSYINQLKSKYMQHRQKTLEAHFTFRYALAIIIIIKCFNMST